MNELINHVWQSTIFAFAVALLTLAFRRNRAEVRHSLWFTASIKFLVPFSLLFELGAHLPRESIMPLVAPRTLSTAVVTLSAPLRTDATLGAPRPTSMDRVTPALFFVWIAGFSAITCLRLRGYLRMRAAIRSSVTEEMIAPCEVRCSPTLLEPGLVGWIRPMILLPAGIRERLTSAQMTDVLAHELCHLRRRDNLTSAIQMVAEAVFWFHPLVWWIGARMLEERERACDEEVLRLGGEPSHYAETILAVCRWYSESPLACSPGMAGSNIRKRIEAILNGTSRPNLNVARKLLLAVAGVIAVAGPLWVGVAGAPVSLWAQAVPAFPSDGGKQLSFDVASVKPDKSSAPPKSNFPLNAGDMYTPNGGLFSATNFPLVTYIAFAYKLMGNQLQVLAPQLPGWAMTDRFDIEARTSGNPTKDQMRLMMRSLLADRFKFRVHTEARETSVLAFVLAKPGKTGPQLQAHASDVSCPTEVEPTSGTNQIPPIFFQKTPGGFPAVCNTVLGIPPSVPGRSRFGARNVTIAYIADMFSQLVNRGRPMIDETGLKGTFDFVLEFVPDMKNPTSPDAAPATEPDGPTFDEGLRDQLGIRMEARRAPMQMIVVDNVERPSEN